MKSPCKELLDRAIATTVAAIDIYNKPDFLYRAETFSILAINGWELLLKAKWLSEHDDKIRSIYMTEPAKKDGTKSEHNQSEIKRTRSGNPITHSLYYLAKKLVEQKHLSQTAMGNIEALLELRNSSVHFYNQSDTALASRLQGIGAASLKNFVLAVRGWFDRDLSEFNFYLMPLSFVCLPQQMDAIVFKEEEQNFLRYLKQLEEMTDEEDSGYAVTLNIDVRFTRSKSKDVPEVRPTKNPDAPEVRLTEEQIREQYPWDYDKLIKECVERYANFKCNPEFHDIKRRLLEEDRFCHVRYLNPYNKKSSNKKFYKANILQELDKHYSRK